MRLVCMTFTLKVVPEWKCSLLKRGRDHLLDRGFSAADIMMGFTLMAAQQLKILDDDSVLVPYLQRLMAREAFVRAAEKTGNLA